MITRIYDYIIKSYIDKYEESKMINIYLIILFIAIEFLWNVFYTILLVQLNIYDLAMITIFNVIAFMLGLYFALFKRKIEIVHYIIVIAICTYVFLCTYLTGYEKSAYAILLPLFFSLHILSIVEKRHFWYLVGIISITHFLVIFLRYFGNPIHGNEYQFIEWINIALGLSSIGFIIYAKALSVEFSTVYKKAKTEYLEKKVNTDFLTGLWNRKFMENLFLKERVHKESYLIFCDIDHFKKVNDNYGHLGGDFVLKEISQLLSSYFREDDYVARWGGEEFLIYVKSIKSFDIISKLESLRILIENKSFIYENFEIKVTMTFGVKSFSEEDEMKKSIALADEALYYGKDNGRNRVIYYEDIY
ncbi:MAG: GGDEF domain-containing protein [Lachnospirales bacterium]